MSDFRKLFIYQSFDEMEKIMSKLGFELNFKEDDELSIFSGPYRTDKYQPVIIPSEKLQTPRIEFYYGIEGETVDNQINWYGSVYFDLIYESDTGASYPKERFEFEVKKIVDGFLSGSLPNSEPIKEWKEHFVQMQEGFV